MSKKQPNKFIAPIVIAGITVGFLASAYKFVFAKPKQVKNPETVEQKDLNIETEHEDRPQS